MEMTPVQFEAVSVAKLQITSPKRSRRQTGWEGFFPYYAGFPESFAEGIIESACLPANSKILDPWNGSGTTTYTASRLGYLSTGIDLNPVMVVVARARGLPPSEADSLRPLGREILARAACRRVPCLADDPILAWLGPSTAAWTRSVECASRELLLGDQTLTPEGINLSKISGIAASFYVVLFAVCHELTAQYRTSNPTWLRRRREGQRRSWLTIAALEARFSEILDEMVAALAVTPSVLERAAFEICLADTTQPLAMDSSIDLVVTSPPYCTRIDYTAATRIQLAVMWPLMSNTTAELSLKMTGSVRVPLERPTISETWGRVCHQFLGKVAAHHSKASSGYYLRTHLDYFSKMDRSFRSISQAVKTGGTVILVVQDSYYKDVHNDLPAILSEMSSHHSLSLCRREDFPLVRTLANRHPHTRSYREKPDALEAVLCFTKLG